MKKSLLTLGVSAAIFLIASQALAASLDLNSGASSVVGQTMQQNGQKMTTGMTGNMGYRTMMPAQMMAYRNSKQANLFVLMFVITVALVWTVLLLLILLLFKLLKKHKHQ